MAASVLVVKQVQQDGDDILWLYGVGGIFTHVTSYTSTAQFPIHSDSSFASLLSLLDAHLPFRKVQPGPPSTLTSDLILLSTCLAICLVNKVNLLY